MRLIIWPLVFLLYVVEALNELRWRLWLAMWVTANYVLGTKSHLELACIVLRRKAAQRRLGVFRAIRRDK